MILEEWSRADDAGAAGRRAGDEAPGASSPARSAAPGLIVLQPPPIRGLSQTGGFEFEIEDREGKGVEALAPVTDRFLDAAREAARAGRGLHAVLGPRPPAPLRRSTGPRPAGSTSPVSDVFDVLQSYLGGLYVNDFNLYGKVWKVMVQAEGARPRASPTTSSGSTS